MEVQVSQNQELHNYKLSSKVAFERFSDGGVLFIPGELKRIKLNKMGAEVISLCDGKHTLSTITRKISDTLEIDNERVAGDVSSFLHQLEENGLVEIMEEKGMIADDQLLYRNPDVSCRDEPPEGAILFNPDSNELMAINTTGLLIWKILEKPGTRATVLKELRERCDGIPEDSIEEDVYQFIDNLKSRGFIGIEFREA